jgi:uncharacterized cupin superfamily protein
MSATTGSPTRRPAVSCAWCAPARSWFGLWRPNGVAGEKIEYELDAEETLVVLGGSGELRVDEGEPIELRPGVVVSLSRGTRLSWLVDADFRELWVYS